MNNDGNFWRLIRPDGAYNLVDDPPLLEERAIEIMRRCSSAQLFKGILGRLAMIIGYSRQFASQEEALTLTGSFHLNPETIIFEEQSCRIVSISIDVYRSSDGRKVASSGFNLIITLLGRIVNVRNNL